MRATVRPVVLWLLLLIPLAFATSSAAQSFLGSIRGTVVDPQGAAVKGAAVLITDEATGVPRALETDDQGRYEAPYLQPGMYKVEVMSPSFKKFEKTTVLVRAAGTALVDVTLEVGGVNETITVSGEAANNITLDSQAISRGLDAQQLHDLPRSSRDIQSFLLLNPNVVGGSDDIQFLGAKTYGVSYIQDGQASTNAIFGTVGNSAPGLDAVEELQVLSNSYSAEYGGLAGVVVTTKRGGQQYRGTGFFDYNADGLNALTYNQTLSGVERGDPLSDTHERRWGGSIGGPLLGSKLFFYGSYEGSNDKAIYGGGRATVPTAAMRAGDFSGSTIVPNRSDDRRTVPRPADPRRPYRSVRAEDHGLFLSAAEPGKQRRRLRRLPAVPPGDAQAASFRPQARLGADQERQRIPPRQLSTSRSAKHHIRGGECADEHAHPRVRAEHVIGHRWLDEDLLLHDGQRVPGRLQLRQFEAAEHLYALADVAAQLGHRECAEPGQLARVPVVHVRGRIIHDSARQHRRPGQERQPDAAPERLLDQRQRQLDQGRPTR